MLRWEPRVELTKQEEALLKTVARTRRLFGFLRCYREQLFDEAFQAELASMYRDTGAGKDPVPPAFMAMVVLLQAYTHTSDAEAVQRSVVDLLWQMALDCIGSTTPPFSQGALHDFRHRLIEHDLDRRLLERTAELATEVGLFDGKKIPKTLRVAADSKPLQGAGRVEDTFNLLGHAARDIVRCVAELLEQPPEEVAEQAGITIVLESSTKLALDTDWTDPSKKANAMRKLVKQLDRLKSYIESQLPGLVDEPPLRDHLKTLERIIEQDLEPDPNDPSGKAKRIRDGVAKDRRVSVRDPDMRHGRKTRTKTFNGYKQHVALDLDCRLILACAVLPANAREFDALPLLSEDLARYDRPLAELHVDRGYVTPSLAVVAEQRGFTVISKPKQMPPNSGLFTKRNFKFDLKRETVQCPAGQVLPFTSGQTVNFDASECARCGLRSSCTRSTGGRKLAIAEDELAQQRFLRLARSPNGRTRLRERIAVEHRLAHLKQKQGDRARYLGARSNLYDVRRTSAALNLEMIDFALHAA